MRIAMVTASVSQQGAGIARAVEGVSGALTARGHDVRVFALEDEHWPADAREWEGAPVTTFPIRGPAALGYAPDMSTQLRKFAPDIAHLHGLWMHTARSVTQWAHGARRPFMVSPHGMLSPAALAYSRAKKRIARFLYQDRCFRRVTGFHATSEAEAEQIRAFGLSQPVSVYPNGITLRDPPIVYNRQKTILSLGRLHPVKGLDVLIAAWARLSTVHPDWQLRIVGPDDSGYGAQLRRQAEAMGIKNISFDGPLFGEDKFHALAEAGLFVLPSRTENFALTVLESLMMGTPVIASHGTPWSGLVEHGCGDWVAATPEAFAEAISAQIKKSTETRTQMSQSAQDWVRQSFTWSSVAASAEAAYLQHGGQL